MKLLEIFFHYSGTEDPQDLESLSVLLYLHGKYTNIITRDFSAASVRSCQAVVGIFSFLCCLQGGLPLSVSHISMAI